jgi:hypothetical protein
MTHALAQDLASFDAWRMSLVQAVDDFGQWLAGQELSDASIERQLAQLKQRLAEDKLNVAFVAEFSRGKSELINAIFFAEYGQRLLPSSAGRTTMCPTELMYDSARPVGMALLPIETRATPTPVSEYKRDPAAWTQVALDIDSAEAMSEALAALSETRRVAPEQARTFGLYDPEDPDHPLLLGEDGLVDMPRWRHAILNFPHPLLKQGLVILDTPGLNAIGAEPELTLNLLPSAHAVLFILGVDTGVTQSDLEVWRQHIARLDSQHALVVLNKIDSLWDDIRDARQIEAEIRAQTETCAKTLGLSADRIYPISAQKALLARISRDPALLARSRIMALEEALSRRLLPSRRDLLAQDVAALIDHLVARTRGLLDARMHSADEQEQELVALRGKNQGVIEHMLDRARADKERFERGLARFQALRSVFSKQSNELFAHLGMGTLRTQVRGTREAMIASHFSRGLREAMSGFFSKVHGNIESSSAKIDDIRDLMESMYRKFGAEHGLAEISPPPFAMKKYRKEMERLERTYAEHFNTLLNMLTHEQYSLTAKFFETLASRVVQIFDLANREVESWLKAVMAPMEIQVREHQLQLKRRMESIKRIHKASDALEERLQELAQMRVQLANQMDNLQGLREVIRYAQLPQEEEPQLRVANG